MQAPEQLLKPDSVLPFVNTSHRARLLRLDRLPPRPLVSSALGLFFLEGDLLMANLVHRGWDIPGGHIEPGETPEETVRRETWEETATELDDIRLFAAQRIEITAPCPPDYRYPYPVSYQVFYCGTIAQLHPFITNGETAARGLFDPVQAQQLAWVQTNPELYEVARELVCSV